MILAALRAGERFRLAEGIGLVAALAGLAVRVAPGVSAPSLSGSALMIAAGVAWGIYSLRGRRAGDPLRETARDFAAAVPMTVLLSLVALSVAHLSARGVILAVVSGAATSGLGYVVWYSALRGLTSVRAAIVQLSVPAIAALGGVVFLHERISLRLLLSAALILGGVAIAVVRRAAAVPDPSGAD
jgi:drug/metabolite transporter (DMT)-like permease